MRIEKLMSLSIREFQHSLRPLVKHTVGDVTHVEIPFADGHVVIRYEPRPSVRFGGLLDMPRAIVSLTFKGVEADQQRTYLKRFDLAFQRGGG